MPAKTKAAACIPAAGLIDGDFPVPMTHPDGGSCDRYAAGAAGGLLVPAAEVPVLQSHGFVVAEVA